MKYRQRDSMKEQMMADRGLSLVIVPFWWDKSNESLISLIRETRPDLFVDFSSLKLPKIEKSPPEGFFKDTIPEIGDLMWPSFAPTTNFDPTNWWMGEKYDGMRICWNGITNQLYSKHGTRLFLPQFVVQNLPTENFLDGEAWLGRGNFHECIRIMTAGAKNGNDGSLPYHDLRLVIFDEPNKEMRSEVFETRFEMVLSRIDKFHPFLLLAPYIKCLGKNYFVEILTGGGEGVVARKNASLYEPARSKAMFKFKTQRDAEALIIDHSEDGFICKLEDNEIFETSNVAPNLQNDLKIGDIVSFKYTHTSSNGKPVGVQIYRKRDDVIWGENGELYVPDLHLEKLHNRNPMGFWTKDENINMKKFFDDFATRNSFDSLVPENWYKVKRKDLENAGGTTMLQHFGSTITALQTVYPDIGLKKENFPYYKENDWTNVDTQKKFLDDFAEKNRFDPLVSRNWNSVLRKKIVQEGGIGLLNHYGGSLTSALSSIYSLQFDNNEKEAKDWKDKSQQRQFFDEFALSHSFDPLNTEKWYSIKRRDFAKSGGGSILKYYRDSHVTALLSLYPELDWNINSFSRHKDESEDKDKTILYNFAQNKGFDPLVSVNWSEVSRKEFIDNGGKSILTRYKGSLMNAVHFLIPQLKKS